MIALFFRDQGCKEDGMRQFEAAPVKVIPKWKSGRSAASIDIVRSQVRMYTFTDNMHALQTLESG